MTITKPKKEYREDPSFEWSDIEDYIKQKYGRDLRDWNGKYGNREVEHEPNTEIAYLDFWHWVCDTHEIHNGCFFTLYLRDDIYTRDNGNAPKGQRCKCSHCLKSDAPEERAGWAKYQETFVRKVLDILDEEFPEEDGELQIYVWW